MMTEILAIILAYLLGSVPFAYIVTRLVKGADIRRLGDGNPGAANVTREVGIFPGFAVLLLDAGKGLLVILVARWLGVGQLIVFACGLSVVAGHMWSVFLGFRGGGGAATTIGVLFALVPKEFSISFGLMVVTVLLTGNFGFSVSVGLVSLPLTLWAFGSETNVIIFAIVMSLLLAVKSSSDWPKAIRKLSSQGWREVIIDRRFTLRKKDNGKRS